MDTKPVDIEDALFVLESKSAFIAAACVALGMMQEDDLHIYTNAKVWEGLGWYTDEIALKIKEMKESMSNR